jgi:lipopolysaccharide/colanic/teichoic acid biosynthesis glycosyltransferase
MQVKAGITGYAQVYGKYNTSPHDKLQMDLLYITSPSIFHDLKILLVTLKVIFMKESTQGVKTDEKMESDEQLEADEKMELEWESERKII